MERFIPYEKLSKKEKRALDLARRKTWGQMNPVTRKSVSSKAYNRNKARNWKQDREPIPGFDIPGIPGAPSWGTDTAARP